MTLEMSNPAEAAGASAENTSSNVDTSAVTGTNLTDAAGNPAAQVTKGAKSAADTITAPQAPGMEAAQVAVVGADGKTTYVPNYKYKAALQEKDLDPFFHPLIKDPESEKKVKELFSKVDAFDFVKGKKEHAETQFQSLMNDYENMSGTVSKFNESVQKGDLASAFRLAGITKEQVFKYAQQQIQLMEMPPEQRQQYEQYESAQAQNSELEQKVSSIQKQFEAQATQNRVMQLDFHLARPEIAQFANAWDKNGEPGSFRQFVVEEAKKAFFERKVDLSPEEAVASVMQRFGKFLNVGDTTAQPPQAVVQQTPQSQKPVIPNITGKAASPIKKMPNSIEDLRRLSKEQGL